MASNSIAHDAISLNQWAAFLQALGARPFNLAPGSKVPPKESQWRAAGHCEALLPGHNVGAALPATLLVIDVDAKDGAPGYMTYAVLSGKLGPLPATLTAKTPSGGMHFVFRVDAALGLRCRNSPWRTRPDDPLAGIDLKTEGGYVAVEPSTIDGRPYVWQRDLATGQPHAVAELPTAWVDFILAAYGLRGREAVPAKAEWTARSAEERAAILADLRSALAVLDPDDRDVWIANGERLAELGSDGEALWCEWSATSSRFPGGDGLWRFRGFKGDRTGYASVFKAAEATGKWSNPKRGRRAADLFAVPAEMPAQPTPAALIAQQTMCHSLPGSEDWLALAFAAHYSEHFKHVAGWGWMRRSGHVWVRDRDVNVVPVMRSLMRSQAAGVSDGASALFKKNTALNALILAASDAACVEPMEAFDADAWALNTPGGVVELRGGALRAHKASDRFTHASAVTPDASMATPTFDAFLLDVAMGDGEMVAYLLRLLGYWLTGDRSVQRFWFWHGMGANGKSTLIDLVLQIMGSYATALPAGTLLEQRGERHPTELAMLKGKRLAVCSELPESCHWNEVLIKTLTGDERLVARLMYQDFAEFVMTQKLLAIGNSRPRLRGGDPAMARRVELVPFEADFAGKPDPDMGTKLRAEAPGILAKLIGGLQDWLQQGLRPPKRVREGSEAYLEQQNDLAQWIEERCQKGVAFAETSAVLYQDYRSWVEQRGRRAPHHNAWSERMERVDGVERVRTKDARKLLGLRLRPPAFLATT